MNPGRQESEAGHSGEDCWLAGHLCQYTCGGKLQEFLKEDRHMVLSHQERAQTRQTEPGEGKHWQKLRTSLEDREELLSLLEGYELPPKGSLPWWSKQPQWQTLPPILHGSESTNLFSNPTIEQEAENLTRGTSLEG